MSEHMSKPADKYSPLYFLGSVGAGGLTITFFMYLMFWVSHKGRPVPIYEDVMTAFSNGSTALQAAIAIALIGIAVFAFMNIKALVWNLSAYSAFSKTEAYEKLRNSNAETTLLARPLALAMSVNVLFIVGLVFVPGLWGIRETLFPIAMIAFFLIGVMAFTTIGDFLGRVLTKGGLFDVTAHNSFAQLLPAFALAMIGVGFAAPAAMSGSPVIVGASLIFSTFFGIASVIYTTVAAITAFNSMLHYGTAEEAAPTLMVVVPIMTVLGILFLRQSHGMHTTFDSLAAPVETLSFLAKLLTVEIIFLMLGMLILNRQGYFKDYIFGNQTSPASYALVCPGVAFNVLSFFFVHKGLLAIGIVAKFSVVYWALLALPLIAQFMMIALVFRLNGQHFRRRPIAAAVPAE